MCSLTVYFHSCKPPWHQDSAGKAQSMFHISIVSLVLNTLEGEWGSSYSSDIPVVFIPR